MNIKKENIVNETGKLWYNKKKKIEVEKLMSRETEKMNKALQKFLDANTTEQTTEDLSLSLKYAKKSLKLDPENLDAAFFIAEIEVDSLLT